MAGQQGKDVRNIEERRLIIVERPAVQCVCEHGWMCACLMPELSKKCSRTTVTMQLQYAQKINRKDDPYVQIDAGKQIIC